MKSAAPLAAAFLAAAGPALSGPSTRRQAEMPDYQDADAWCQNRDLRDPEVVGWIWNDWTVGWHMDVMISKSFDPPNKDWVVKFADQTYDNAGNSGAFGCGVRGEECFDNLDEDDCRQMVKDGHADEYWIFTAVRNMQNGYEAAHENLQDAVIESALSVSSMVADILPPDAKPMAAPEDILGYVAAAFTMLGGPLGASPFAATLGGMVGGAASAAALVVAEDPALINTASLDTALRDAFRETRNALDRQLALVVGGEGNYNTLADPGDWYSPISSFFNAGKFLLQGSPNNVFAGGYDLLLRSLVDYALNMNDYAVLGKAGIPEEECSNEADEYGAHWIDSVNGGYCLQLHQHTYDNRFWEKNWLPASAELIDKLQNTYHINMVDYYAAAYDCAVHGNGNSSPDVGALPTDGSVPTCFYRVKCMDSDTGSPRPPGQSYDYSPNWREAFAWGAEGPA